MDPLTIAASVDGIVQVILRVHGALNIFDGQTADKQVARSLETSEQKLRIWQKTWLDSNIDTTTTSTALWGTQGLNEIQKLLQTILVTAQQIEDADKKRYNIKSRPSFFKNEKTQNRRHDCFESKHQSTWKRALQKVLDKKSPPVIVKHLTMLELATELSKSIDQFWTYSEVVFNSLHGGPATRAIDLLSANSADNVLADAIQTRAASIALYHACSKTTGDCSLEVDLFDAGAQLRKGGATSPEVSFSLFYHLSTQIGNSPAEIQDMTIESVTRPDVSVTENGKILEYENPDLNVFYSKSASETGIAIRPKTAPTRFYFRAAQLPANAELGPETQNLAQILYKWKVSSTTSSAQTLSYPTRIELAFKLVECALYLLGTPWLASLDSKRVRRMNRKDGRRPYVLKVQMLDLEELCFEDPEALTEPSQLFRIGVLLVQIALSNPEQSAPTEIEELGLRTSKMLALVQQSMGSQYCKATAFCLRDRRSTSHFGFPEKYQYPEKTGWKPYLLELLEDYHTQVFLR